MFGDCSSLVKCSGIATKKASVNLNLKPSKIPQPCSLKIVRFYKIRSYTPSPSIQQSGKSRSDLPKVSKVAGTQISTPSNTASESNGFNKIKKISWYSSTILELSLINLSHISNLYNRGSILRTIVKAPVSPVLQPSRLSIMPNPTSVTTVSTRIRPSIAESFFDLGEKDHESSSTVWNYVFIFGVLFYSIGFAFIGAYFRSKS